MDVEVLNILMQFVQSFGMSGVFLFLFFQERRGHEQTRQFYRNDLREIAGFHRNQRSGEIDNLANST